jgi:hypothetical protein
MAGLEAGAQIVPSVPVASLGSGAQLVSSVPVAGLGSGAQLVSSVPVAGLGSGAQLGSSVPVAGLGSGAQLGSSVPVLSTVSVGSAIQIMPLISGGVNVTSQNKAVVVSPNKKGNLFDNLETLVPNTKPSTVTNGILDQSSQKSTSSAPKTTPTVFKLSPEVMNKVSMFAANLHSNSLTSKLQGLTKSPSKPVPVQVISSF